MKGLSRGNSIFRKKQEPQEPQEPQDKKNITINLTINLSLDKNSLDRAMDMLELYSDYTEESDSYTSNTNKYKYFNKTS